MDTLNNELQNLIRALEQASAQAGSHGDRVDALLDQLYQQKMDLAQAAAQTAALRHKQAREAMHAACSKIKASLRDKNRLGDALHAVEDASAKLNRVLDHTV